MKSINLRLLLPLFSETCWMYQRMLVQQGASTMRLFSKFISKFQHQEDLTQDGETGLNMYKYLFILFTHPTVMQISAGVDLLDHTHFGRGSVN